MGTVRNARVNQGGPKCAGIVGLGLIGGSFARGYAQAGVRVLAWDPDDDVMTALPDAAPPYTILMAATSDSA